MIKKKMILADQDEMYLKNLSNYFMGKAPQLDLIIFTSKERLNQYLDQGGTGDLLVVDETLADEELEKKTSNIIRVILSSSMTPVHGFNLVKKYQKSEALLNDIMLKYAETTGSAEAIKGSSHTQIAAIYSPGGGTGKTAISLGLASACAKSGEKTLYLNLEEIDSVRDVLAPTQGSLSDIFLALKTKGMNVGVKLAACTGREASGGFFYLSGVESITEYEEVTGTELEKLLETIRALSEYDLVIIDLSSGFSAKTVQILKSVDTIYVPVTDGIGNLAKLKRFLREMDLHDRYHELLQKMQLVVNQCRTPEPGKGLIESGILNQIPCWTMIPVLPAFINYSDIIRSGDLLKDIFGPMILQIKA